MRPSLVITPTLVHGSGPDEFTWYIRYLATLQTRFGDLTMPCRDVLLGEPLTSHEEARTQMLNDAHSCVAELARQFAPS